MVKVQGCVKMFLTRVFQLWHRLPLGGGGMMFVCVLMQIIGMDCPFMLKNLTIQH